MRIRKYGSDIDNRMLATESIRESLFGRGGDDVFVIYHHDYDLNDPDRDFGPDQSDRFFGGAGNDTLGTLYFDFTVIGDYAASYSDYSQISFDGGKGYDTVSSDVVLHAVDEGVLDLSLIQTSVRSVEHWDYDISLGTSGTVSPALNEGSFAIRSGAQDDTLRIAQYQDCSDAEISISTLGGSDTVGYMAYSDIGLLSIDTGKGHDVVEFSARWAVSAEVRVSTGNGNDTVVINGSTVSHAQELDVDIRTGKGKDTIVLEGMHGEELNAGGGNDDIYILTGSFANAADTIMTGGGRDRLFVELDAYSTVAVVQDFSASKDVFVFDQDEAEELLPRNTLVTFDRSEWEDAEEDRLFMDNDADRLYFGDNVLVEFSSDVTLTAENFTTGEWEFFA